MARRHDTGRLRPLPHVPHRRLPPDRRPSPHHPPADRHGADRDRDRRSAPGQDRGRTRRRHRHGCTDQHDDRRRHTVVRRGRSAAGTVRRRARLVSQQRRRRRLPRHPVASHPPGRGPRPLPDRHARPGHPLRDARSPRRRARHRRPQPGSARTVRDPPSRDAQRPRHRADHRRPDRLDPARLHDPRGIRVQHRRHRPAPRTRHQHQGLPHRAGHLPDHRGAVHDGESHRRPVAPGGRPTDHPRREGASA